MQKIHNKFLVLITFVLAPVFYVRILLNKLSKNRQLKILVIATGKIGDLVCVTPVFRAIKKKFPESYLVVGIREQSYGVVQNNPHIDKFLFINSKKYRGFSGILRLIKDVSREKIDYSVNLNPGFLGTILPFWCGIPVRITSASRYVGKAARLSLLFSTHRLEYGKRASKLRHDFELLKFLGIKDFSNKKEVFIKEEEEEKATKFLRDHNLRENDFLVGISITAGNKFREWEPSRFGQLADKLIKELGAKVIFTGAESDAPAIKKVISDMKNEAIASTNFKLNELVALLKKMKLFISVDTGPMHIAHAVGVPLVDIVGPVDVNAVGPVDINIQPPRDEMAEIVRKDIYCAPCCFYAPESRYCKEGHLRCLMDVTVNDVFEAATKLLNRITK